MNNNDLKDLWEILHEANAIASVSAHGLNFEDSSNSANNSSYATLQERASKILLKAIAIVDSSGVDFDK